MEKINPMDDEYYAIQMVQEHQYKKSLQEAEERSLNPKAVPYKTYVANKKNAQTRAKVFILAAVASLAIAVPVVNQANKNQVTRIANEISAPLKENKQFGDVNPNTGKPYWWYDTYHMYEDFDQDTEFSVDAKIYSAYLSLKNEFNGMETLSGLVKHLTGINSFQEYLQKNGYNLGNLKVWEKDMNRVLLEYSQSKENLEFVEGSFGGR